MPIRALETCHEELGDTFSGNVSNPAIEKAMAEKIFPASTIPPVLDRVFGVELRPIKFTLLVCVRCCLIHYTPIG
jgi:hypothetical protein